MDTKGQLRSAQYIQLSEDFRLYDRQFWQMPSVLVLICSAVIGVSYSAVADLWARGALLIIGFALSLALGIALVKYRFFQATRIEALRTLEEDPDTGLVKVQRVTKQGPKTPSNWPEKQPAFLWMIGATFLMSLVLLALSLANFVLAVKELIC